MLFRYLKSIFDGTLDTRPEHLTLVQSVIVTVLAILMAVGLYLTVGVHYPGVGYQILATLVIASILAPIFLYPTFRTASRLRRANAIIREQAFTDRLTKLPNSFALSQELGTWMSTAGGNSFAVHFLDINHLKDVNEGLGHEAGDSVLVAVAEQLTRRVAPEAFLARFGGDEFVVLQPGVRSGAEATEFALDLITAVSRHYDIAGFGVALSATAGTAIAPQHGAEAGDILKAANMALFKAKARGAGHAVFDVSLARAAVQRRDIEMGLRKALENEELELLYQPIVRAGNSLRVVAFEALMRWRLPDGTVVAPDDFIPVAESTGMIVEMGKWALRMACRECATWRGNVRVAVNVSPVQFQQSNFFETVSDVLHETGLPPDRLDLEITESVLITDIAHVEPTLKFLRQMGIRIALDDFGSGFCGLHYLRRFMIDKIKVDKSIIDEAMNSEKAANILRGVAKIAAEIGSTVIVEGVDTFEKADFIQRENCADELQGFLYSRPIQAAVVPMMLAYLSDNEGKSAEVVPLDRFLGHRSRS